MFRLDDKGNVLEHDVSIFVDPRFPGCRSGPGDL
jgi:hypothetical protein